MMTLCITCLVLVSCLVVVGNISHVCAAPVIQCPIAGNEFQTEALPQALPDGQNNPRVSALLVSWHCRMLQFIERRAELLCRRVLMVCTQSSCLEQPSQPHAGQQCCC